MSTDRYRNVAKQAGHINSLLGIDNKSAYYNIQHIMLERQCGDFFTLTRASWGHGKYGIACFKGTFLEWTDSECLDTTE